MQLQAALTPAYKELLEGRSLHPEQKTPRGPAHDADPRGVQAFATVLSTPAAGEENLHGDTKNAAK